MNEKEIAEIVYEKWESQMTTDKRQHQLLDQNFNMIAEDLFVSGVSFKVARDTFKKAINYMKPSAETINFQYGKSKFKKFRNKQEFATEWIKSVEKIANRVFYSFYEIESVSEDGNKTTPINKPINSATTKVKVAISSGMKTDDELNSEDFWNSMKTVSPKSPWLFADKKEDDNG